MSSIDIADKSLVSISSFTSSRHSIRIFATVAKTLHRSDLIDPRAESRGIRSAYKCLYRRVTSRRLFLASSCSSPTRVAPGGPCWVGFHSEIRASHRYLFRRYSNEGLAALFPERRVKKKLSCPFEIDSFVRRKPHMESRKKMALPKPFSVKRQSALDPRFI